MKRQIIYEKLFNFSRWFILVKVITIHQVKRLPTALVSILIPEFGYTTISLDYSSLPWNMYLKRWFYLDFVGAKYFVTNCCAVGGNILYAKANTFWIFQTPKNMAEFLTSSQEVRLIDGGQRESHLLFTCQTVCKAINVFSVCPMVSPCSIATSPDLLWRKIT